MVRLAGQAARFFVQDNEQEEGFSGFILELGFSRDSFTADLAIVSVQKLNRNPFAFRRHFTVAVAHKCCKIISLSLIRWI
jgi:hypothetical protein